MRSLVYLISCNAVMFHSTLCFGVCRNIVALRAWQMPLRPISGDSGILCGLDLDNNTTNYRRLQTTTDDYRRLQTTIPLDRAWITAAIVVISLCDIIILYSSPVIGAETRAPPSVTPDCIMLSH